MTTTAMISSATSKSWSLAIHTELPTLDTLPQADFIAPATTAHSVGLLRWAAAVCSVDWTVGPIGGVWTGAGSVVGGVSGWPTSSIWSEADVREVAGMDLVRRTLDVEKGRMRLADWRWIFAERDGSLWSAEFRPTSVSLRQTRHRVLSLFGRHGDLTAEWPIAGDGLLVTGLFLSALFFVSVGKPLYNDEGPLSKMAAGFVLVVRPAATLHLMSVGSAPLLFANFTRSERPLAVPPMQTHRHRRHKHARSQSAIMMR